MTPKHTCDVTRRMPCAACRQFEIALFGAIDAYAIAVGGDPTKHVYGNTARMQAVAEVDRIVQTEFANLLAHVTALERDQAHLIADLNLSGPDSACCRARHRAEDECTKLRTDLAAMTAARDQACAGWERQLCLVEQGGSWAHPDRTQIDDLRTVGTERAP